MRALEWCSLHILKSVGNILIRLHVRVLPDLGYAVVILGVPSAPGCGSPGSRTEQVASGMTSPHDELATVPHVDNRGARLLT